MPAFEHIENHLWRSLPSAQGPFKGLQGGALAALMVSELEAIALAEDLGSAVSVSVDFLRPTIAGEISTNPEIIRRGGRVSFLSSSIFQAGELTAKASACVISDRALPIETPIMEAPPSPDQLSPLPPRKAPHGGPWMMDNFEVRISPEGIFWFRYIEEMFESPGMLSRILGPADWTHGLSRPGHKGIADPNVNLQVTLFRAPKGRDIGIIPSTQWMPSGIGFGEGVLMDIKGHLGRVMMAVALTPTH